MKTLASLLIFSWMAFGQPLASVGSFTTLTETSASSSVYTFTLTPALTGYPSGAGQLPQWTWKVGTTCTGGAITGNVNALGAAGILNPDGTNPTIAQCTAGQKLILTYDSVAAKFVIVGGEAPGGAGSITAGTTVVGGSPTTNGLLYTDSGGVLQSAAGITTPSAGALTLTGQLIVPAGNTGVVALRFAGAATNTGFSNVNGVSGVSFFSAGAESLRLTGSGYNISYEANLAIGGLTASIYSIASGVIGVGNSYNSSTPTGKLMALNINPGYVTFATLPASPANGDMVVCSDCTIANPTAGSGAGALVVRVGAAWVGK